MSINVSLELLQAALSSIDLQTRTFDYESQFVEAGNIYLFKISFSKALQQFDCQTVHQFCCECFKMIAFKTIHDYLEDKGRWAVKEEDMIHYQQLIKITQLKSMKIGPLVGKYYCQILNQFKEKKSQLVEFLLFLIFLCSQKIMQLLAEEQPVFKILDDKNFLSNMQLPKISCIMINYQITKVKVSESVYKELFNRYVKGKKQEINALPQHLRNSKGAKNFFDLKKSAQRRRERKKKYTDKESLEFLQMKKQLQNILWKNTEKNNKAKENKNDIHRTEEEKSNIVISPLNLNLIKNDSIKTIAKSVSRVLVKNYPIHDSLDNLAKSIKKTARRNNRQKTQNEGGGKKKIISQFALLFLNDQKSKQVRHSNKIENWKEVIKQIALKDKFEKQNFDPSHQKRKPRHNQPQVLDYCSQYYQKHERFQQQLNKMKQKNLYSNKLSQSNVPMFYQNILKRQTTQMGIVRNIINYRNYGPQERKRKLNLMNLKKEQRQFLTEGQFDTEQFDSFSKQFQQRVQMAIIGKKVI